MCDTQSTQGFLYNSFYLLQISVESNYNYIVYFIIYTYTLLPCFMSRFICTYPHFYNMAEVDLRFRLLCETYNKICFGRIICCGRDILLCERYVFW